MANLRAGTILRVDLTSGKITREPSERYDAFLGGRGVNIRILYEETAPGVDALSPENVLIFGTGPLTGSFVPGTGRTVITAKSPMTGFLGESNMGGYWSNEFKWAGYDHLVVTGKAPHPVYILVRDDDVRICDASHLWSKDLYYVTPALRKELGDPDIQVVGIGRGGENLVRYASVLTHLGDGAGRTGMGAVMGSKNLKAVAVRGTRGLKAADADAFFAACQKAHMLIRNHPTFESKRADGITPGTENYGHTGIRMSNNYQSSSWEHADDVSPFRFRRANLVQQTGCFDCPIHCMEHYNYEGVGPVVVSCGPYADLTWKVGNPDMKVWLEAIAWCQREGVDPVSVSAMIAWAMELYERGIITDEDTGGIPMVWGDREAIVGMIEKIVKREGFGDILAEGPLRAAKKIGRGSEAYAIHTKGLPHHSANQMNYRGNALAAATGSRGDFTRGMATAEMSAEEIRILATDQAKAEEERKPYIQEAQRIAGTPKAIEAQEYEGKAAMVEFMENVVAITDSIMHCKWHSLWLEMPISPEVLAELYSAGTGRHCTVDDLFQIGRRVITLERSFNVREGVTRADDTLPERFFKEPMAGVWPNDIVDRAKFEKMKDEYYTLRGWDVATGMPTRQTLEALGLKDVADDLERKGKLVAPVPAEVAVR